jgi:hypothetical protein
MQPGDKVKIIFVDFMSKEEQLKLRELDFTVTVEDEELFGAFYAVEFPGYLFTEDNYSI